jgi:hypothetical protein
MQRAMALRDRHRLVRGRIVNEDHLWSRPHLMELRMVHRTYSEIAQEYDEIAHEYRDSKLLPFRDYVESYSLFRLIGKLDGRTVLDLACVGSSRLARRACWGSTFHPR